MPGLGWRRVASVETFDAEFLGHRHKVGSRVTFSAGLESAIEQRGLGLIARLRKARLVPDPNTFIPLLLAVRNITRLTGSDRGGMSVDVKGLNKDGIVKKSRWSLLAERDDGPFVPILPAAAAVRTLLAGGLYPGARLAPGSVSLADIEAEMRPYSISTTINETPLEHSVFARGLGQETFDTLPAAVSAFHDQDGAPVWSGEADVETARSLVPSLIARVLGFPVVGRRVPICVTVERDRRIGNPDRSWEIWTRDFAGRRFSSTLECHPDGTFTEAFGLFCFKIGLQPNDAGLAVPVTGWRLGGIPLPRCLVPRSKAREYQDDMGRFRFDVKLTLPFLGLFAHYRGWLLPNRLKTDDPARTRGCVDDQKFEPVVQYSLQRNPIRFDGRCQSKSWVQGLIAHAASTIASARQNARNVSVVSDRWIPSTSRMRSLTNLPISVSSGM